MKINERGKDKVYWSFLKRKLWSFSAFCGNTKIPGKKLHTTKTTQFENA